MKRIVVLIVMLDLFANFVFAGDVDYGGDGCPFGTAEITSNDDGIKLTFASYELQKNTAQPERRSCNIAITFTVPLGYSANFGTIAIAGSYHLTDGATTSINTESFFAGSRGPRNDFAYKSDNHGAIDARFTPNVGFSACGSAPIFRLNTSIILANPQNNQSDSGIRIDEISIGKPLLRKCS